MLNNELDPFVLRTRIFVDTVDRENWPDQAAEGFTHYVEVDLYDPGEAEFDGEQWENMKVFVFFPPHRSGWRAGYRTARELLRRHDLDPGDWRHGFYRSTADFWVQIKREEDALAPRDDARLILLLWLAGFDLSASEVAAWIDLQWDAVARWLWTEAQRAADLPTEDPAPIPHCLAGRRRLDATLTPIEFLAEAAALFGYRATLPEGARDGS